MKRKQGCGISFQTANAKFHNETFHDSKGIAHLMNIVHKWNVACAVHTASSFILKNVVSFILADMHPYWSNMSTGRSV
eukprot:CCRYP_015943-RA/>CCRYP_015943-RA protein AED:0.00 eAED:0.00 QI:195/1/1/1/0/0/2/40/77